jgi:hypothetical protein
MTTSRVQTLRSSTTGAVPAAGARQPGELWLNFADFALGFIDAAKNAQRITAVRYFQTTANYAVGDFVIQVGALYVANQAVTAGAFSASQWTKIATASDIPAGYVLPPASTTVLGGVKVDGTTITATGAGVISTAGGPPANPNRLDNGDMWVDQHNGGASVAVPAAALNFFTPDRWAPWNNKAKLTVGQNYSVTTKAPGFQYFQGVQVTGGGAAPAAADYNYVSQLIELDAFSDFAWGTVNAQPATLSFWVNSSLTGNFSVSFQGQAATPSRIFITTYNIPTANTWTKIVVPIPADTTVSSTNWTGAGNAPGAAVNFDLGSGANVQTSTGLGAWQNSATAWVASGSVKLVATSNAKWAITGVKLEAGSVATPYPVEDLARKMARCQRYYQVFGGSNTISIGYNTAGGLTYTVIPLPYMRAAPTAVFSNITYNNTSAIVLAESAPNRVTTQCSITATGFGYAYGTMSLSAEI